MGSALVARPAPSFMTTAWPRVFERIAETDIFDFCEGRGNAKGRGPNHVRKQKEGSAERGV